MFILFLIFLVIAYLLGSLSSAVLVSKALGLADPRQEGSGNPGATNVLRVGGRQAGLYVLLGDLLKGLLPVLIARMFGLTGFYLSLIALAAVVGHIFPLFFGFKGGKGVATALGAILGMSFILGIIAIIVWAAVVAATRYVSLASLIASLVALLLSPAFVGIAAFLPLLAMVALIAWRHQENIVRLRAGTEPKVDWSTLKS